MASFTEKTGVSMVAGFKLQSEKHLDLRFEVDTLDGLDELYQLHAAPPGLTSYVDSESCAYTHVGNGTWVKNITSANEYTHPTTAGNKHIPEGGTAGQYLINTGESGTVKWQDPVIYTGGSGIDITDTTIKATNITTVDKNGNTETDNIMTVTFTD